MPVASEIDQSTRIWFLPNEYWHATKGMAPEDVDRLMCEVERLAAARDFEALQKYPFIYIGQSCHRREARETATAA